ncbi:efflux transporter outer membrane subunit [Pseudomonas putida]|uniref:efflux transporter outer membrane subunit n=1 Tax=Pseudomonas putida TaxID=303 RepID=UPI003A101C19
MHKLLLLTVVVSLAACSFIPTYQRPDMPVPAAYTQGATYVAEHGDERAPIDWQHFFKDPALHRLIDLSLVNNRDLRKAALNVAAYRAQFQIQRSALFPEIGLDGEGERSRSPAGLSDTGKHLTSGDSGVSVGLTSYELDVWGRIRSLSQEAQEIYLASEEARRSVRIGLVADVAVAYLTWHTDRNLLRVTRSTLENYDHSLALIQASSDAGTASELDVRQARTLVDSARGQVQAYTREVAQDLNALRLLVGTDLPADMPTLAPGAQVLAQVPPGLPANLLQQRPDIRAAEHQLVAANANIGAARAAFFPSISLTASAGTASSQLSGLFEPGSESWAFVPQIHMPIFNGGRLSASLNYARIQKSIEVADYEKTVQTAFREVTDGLAAVETWKEALESQEDLVSACVEYAQMAQQRYDEGVDSYLTLLDAQRQLLTARQKLLTDRLAQRTAQIQLYKALGGGWSASDSDQIAVGPP